MNLLSIDTINSWSKNTLMEFWGVEFTRITATELWATMPVTDKVKQPYGLLHGGATATLAETIGSTGSAVYAGKDHIAIGLQITANHLRSATEGIVTGKGFIVHKGRSTHLWDINIYDDQDRLLSTCRLTNFIKPR